MLIFKIIDRNQQDNYNEQFKNFEKKFSYSFGADRFTISHGNNYFHFFNNLGETTHLIALHENNIVASIALILRTVKINNINEKIYYLCDLKILHEYRGKNIIHEFIKFAYQSNILLTEKCYSISMNDENRTLNRLSKITARIKNLNLEYDGTILIYLLDRITLKTVESNLYQYFGSYEFKSLRGIKDLILQSTGQALNFLHLSCSNKLTAGSTRNFASEYDIDSEYYNGSEYENDTNDIRYMFCLPELSPLVEELRSKRVGYAATASILQKNMSQSTWDFITTDEL